MPKKAVNPDHMTEAQEQTAVIKWTMRADVREMYPELQLLYHIPNGGNRDPVEAAHLKQQGVKRGVPDLCLPVSRDGYHALYIEMKSKTGRARPEQMDWIRELQNQGCMARVCHGWKEAVRLLEAYMNGRKPNVAVGAGRSEQPSDAGGHEPA